MAAFDIENASCEQVLNQANELAHRFFSLAGGTRHPDFQFYRGSLPLERMVWDQAKLVFADVFNVNVDHCVSPGVAGSRLVPKSSTTLPPAAV